MEITSFKSQEKCSSILFCCVCGDIARGVNFAAITCMSCKMFFRRHAQLELLKQKCQLSNKCLITKKTRKLCPSCRLKQCFNVGMDPQLIRCSIQQKRKILPLSKLTSFNLLNKEHSILLSDEWYLLTNIINTYDEQNLFLKTTDFLKNQISLPPKIRSKDVNTLNHISYLYSTIYKFINRCPFFYSLSFDIRKELIKRNLNLLGSFNLFFMGKKMNIFENENYSKFIDNIYGYGYSNSLKQASQRLQENETLIKIMLIILIFSSNLTILNIDQFDNNQIILDTKILIHIQNIFINLLWKYLIYQYGFQEAILRLSSLVKSILDQFQRIDQCSKVEKHWTMIRNVIEQTTHSLNIEN